MTGRRATGGLSREELEVLELLLREDGEDAAPAARIRPQPDRSSWELSAAQERLWFLDQMEPGTSAYTMSAALRLRGDLDVEVLARSLNEVVRRHASLRTTFVVRDGRPRQVVAPELHVEVPVSTLDHGPRREREERVRHLADEEAARPFDLARGPLLRARLLKLGDREHVLVVSVHHIVSDGWSVGILLRELGALYRAFLEGRPSPLPELEVQYPDFACWQREHLRGEAAEREVRYWRERLAGDPPPLDLPTDRPRPPIQGHFRGASVRTRLHRDLSEALQALGLRHEATLFMVLLAALQVLLHRLSGQADVLVGCPVAGRDRAEVEGLIGCFLNTLVLRGDLSGRPTFQELLGRVREVALEAYEHQQVPFERLLTALQPERDLSRTPFFQVFLNMLNLPEVALELPGIEAEYLWVPEVGSKFDLTIYAQSVPDGLDLKCTYNPDLFDEERVDEMLDQLRVVLAQAAEDPERPIDDLSLLTPRCRERLPDPYRDLDDTWQGAVHELVARQVQDAPDRVAVIDRHGVWSYSELGERVARLGRLLLAAGVERERPVALWAYRGASLAAAVLGALEAGTAFVLLDPAYPARRLIEIVKRARPQAWVLIPEAGPPPRELEEAVASLPGCHRVELPGRAEGPEGWGPPAGGGHARPQVGPDDLACLSFTSGSTGVPKGILGRHGPLSHFLPWQRDHFRLGTTDRFSMLSGLAHDPLQRDVFTALCLGATLCVPDPEEMLRAGALAAWMERQQVSVAHLTPAMGQVLAEPPPDDPPRRVPSLRYAFLVGDVLTRADADRLRRLAPGITCVNMFGSTETQRAVSFYPVSDETSGAGGQALPLGRGLADVQLLVLNAADRLAGIGELGEICIRSPHLARGYLDDEAATRERFRDRPFTGRPGDRLYRTGDLGRYLPGGDVVFVGRADSQVTLRGYRIETGEIETRLREHPEVRGAAVVLREDRPGDRRLVAYLTRAGEATPAADALADHLRTTLIEPMVPSAFVFLYALPLNPNGKLDSRKLPAPATTRPELQAPYQEPRTELERSIAAVWREVLGIDRVGRDDRFFELGGHSLKLVELRAKLESSLDTEVPLSELFNHCTVGALARYVSRSPGDGGSVETVEGRADAMSSGRERLERRLALRRRGASIDLGGSGASHG